MIKTELLSYDQWVLTKSIQNFQRKIESLLYAVIITWIDIVFMIFWLVRFLTNSSSEHHSTADCVLHYLYRYQSLALKLGGADNFLVVMDASFADNLMNQKSSQVYIMVLFDEVIGWQANKQNTITTSTTEAELLSLSQEAKEGQYIKCLLDELNVSMNDQCIWIHCDNHQMICLVTEEIAHLQIKLRHVDIHNHWLCQKIRDEQITVEHVSIKRMIANKLTKVLPWSEFREFLDQVNLVDIANQIVNWEAQDNDEELDHNMLQAYMGEIDWIRLFSFAVLASATGVC